MTKCLVILSIVLLLASGAGAQGLAGRTEGRMTTGRHPWRPLNAKQAQKFLIAQFGIPRNAEINSFDCWPSLDPKCTLPGSAFISWTVSKGAITHFFSAGYDFDRNVVTGQQHRAYAN